MQDKPGLGKNYEGIHSLETLRHLRQVTKCKEGHKYIDLLVESAYKNKIE